LDDTDLARFQNLVDEFQLAKPGAKPFDADLLDDNYVGASHGEKVSIAFILNVWNPGHEWQAGRFNVMDALFSWDVDKRKAFVAWAAEPWWP